MFSKSPSQVAIFWDFENCRPPSNAAGSKVVDNIRRLVQGYGSITTFRAYIDLSLNCANSKSISLHSELQLSGISLVHCPHNGKKDVADKMMIVDMLTFAIDRPAPACIVLVTGDRDFAYAAAVLRLRGYSIIAITPSHSHASLKVQADELYDWQKDILDADGAVVDPGRKRSDSSASSASQLSIPIVSVTSTPPMYRTYSCTNAEARNDTRESETLTASGQQSESNPLPSSLEASPLPISSYDSDASPSPSFPGRYHGNAETSPLETAGKTLPTPGLSTPVEESSDLASEWEWEEWETASATSEIALDEPVSEPSVLAKPDSSSPHETELSISALHDDVMSSDPDLTGDSTEPSPDASTSLYHFEGTTESVESCRELPASTDDGRSHSSSTDSPKGSAGMSSTTAEQPCSGVESAVISCKSIPSTPSLPGNASSQNPPVPTAEARQRFRGLIDFFIERKAANKSTVVLSSEVATEILKRDPMVFRKAGVKKMKAFVKAARKAGVIVGPGVVGSNGGVWLEINPVLYPPKQATKKTAKPGCTSTLSNKASSSRTLIPTQEDRQRFQTLISFFIEQAAAGQPTRISASDVAQRILKRDKQVYKKAGVTRFKTFVEAVKQAGVITSPGLDEGGIGWLEINPVLYPPAQGVRTRNNTASTSAPPKQTSSSKKTTEWAYAPLTTRLRAESSSHRLSYSALEMSFHLQHPDLYTRASVSGLPAYLEKAAKHGIIRIGSGDSAGTKWAELMPAYRGTVH